MTTTGGARAFWGLLILVVALLGACGSDSDADDSGEERDTDSGGTNEPAPLLAQIGASRIACVAPCLVQFDATGTTARAGVQSFHDVSYLWDFGDPGSGDWPEGARAQGSSRWSRNEERGPIATHVFNPARLGEPFDEDCSLGSASCRQYTVTLTARLGDEVSERSVVIEVDDPDVHFAEATVCLAADADFSECPTGDSSRHFRIGVTPGCDDWDDCVTTVVGSSGTELRILSRRGDVYTSDDSTYVGDPDEDYARGPGMLGAFGSGSNPRIETTGNGLALSAPDWTIESLDFVGVADSTSGATPGWGLRLRDDEHMLVYRSSVADYQNLVIRVGERQNVLGLVETVIGPTYHPSGSFGLLGSGHRLALVGCTIFGVDGGGARTQQAFLTGGNLLQVSHNQLGPSPRVNSDLGLGQADGGVSRYTLISDNYLVHGVGDSGISCCTGVGGNVAEQLEWRDLLIERNLATSEGAGDGHALLSLALAERITVRNNLFILDDINIRAVDLWHPADGDGPQRADSVRILGNSVFSTSDHYWEEWWPPMMTVVSPGLTGVELRGNLQWSEATYNVPPLAACPEGEDCVDVDNWDQVTGGLAANPFVVDVPAVPEDFSLRSGAAPIDQGNARPQLFDDFFGLSREGAPEIGAVEFGD